MGLFWLDLFCGVMVLCDVEFVGIEIILASEAFYFFYPGRTTHVLNVYTARATEPAFSGTTSNRSMNKKKRSNNKMYAIK